MKKFMTILSIIKHIAMAILEIIKIVFETISTVSLLSKELATA